MVLWITDKDKIQRSEKSPPMQIPRNKIARKNSTATYQITILVFFLKFHYYLLNIELNLDIEFGFILQFEKKNKFTKFKSF